MKTNKVKLMTAMMGGGALIAMGALTVANGDISRADPPAPGPVTTTLVTVGETVTETTAITSPVPTVYQPPVTFTTPSGFAVPH